MDLEAHIARAIPDSCGFRSQMRSRIPFPEAKMPRKKKLQRDDPGESERFIAIAKEIEAEPTGKTFERAFPSIARPDKAEAKAQAQAKKRR